jgi:hypothetical protein
VGKKRKEGWKREKKMEERGTKVEGLRKSDLERCLTNSKFCLAYRDAFRVNPRDLYVCVYVYVCICVHEYVCV